MTLEFNPYPKEGDLATLPPAAIIPDVNPELTMKGAYCFVWQVI